jgi:hypothetical protein
MVDFNCMKNNYYLYYAILLCCLGSFVAEILEDPIIACCEINNSAV